jgi:hypothetical protein
MGRIQRSMCAGMLGLQAVVLFLTTPVLLRLTDLDTSTGVVVGLGLAVACVLAAATMRRRFGGALGWLIQVCSLALGVLIPVMVVVGVVFLALYAGAWFVGRRIDEEKAAFGGSGAAPPG